jgi:hypothetical protein
MRPKKLRLFIAFSSTLEHPLSIRLMAPANAIGQFGASQILNAYTPLHCLPLFFYYLHATATANVAEMEGIEPSPPGSKPSVLLIHHIPFIHCSATYSKQNFSTSSRLRNV